MIHTSFRVLKWSIDLQHGSPLEFSSHTIVHVILIFSSIGALNRSLLPWPCAIEHQTVIECVQL